MYFQTILKPIFSFIWKKQLENWKLIKVTGWRSCIIDNQYGQRMRVTFMILFNLFHKQHYIRGNTEAYIPNDTSTFRPRDPNDTSTI